MVDEAAIQALVRAIAAEFDPERIVLFGSRAYGSPRPDSDVDLLVVVAFEGSPLHAAARIANHADPSFALDLIVRTPEDVQRRYSFGDPLIREAIDHGLVLYARAA